MMSGGDRFAKMSKILILGGSGMLGSALISECMQNGIPFDAPKSSILDITKQEHVQEYIFNSKPAAIVNCAAWTDVESAEIQFQNVCKLNADAIRHLALAAKSTGAPLVHISTDYVFNGSKKEKYFEDDQTSPINNYGLSKYLGERNLLEVLPENSYIIRTCWLYGIHGKNFVKSILRKALNKERIQVVQDQIGCPTNSEDLAAGIISILRVKPSSGIYHFSNFGQTSWHEFATKIYKLSGSDVKLVEPIKSSLYSSKVKRPANSVLSTDKWTKAGISKIVQWDVSLVKIFPRIVDSVGKDEKL